MIRPILRKACSIRYFSYEAQYQGRNVYLLPHQHKYTLIWLHGLGGSAFDWKGFFDIGRTRFVSPENTKVTLLSAPIRPISIYRDMPKPAWYNIIETEKILKESEDDVNDSCKIIAEQIHKEAKLLNSYSKIIVGGFSQGCAMALAVSMKIDEVLGGVCGYSGLLFRFTRLSEKKKMPIFLYHGSADNVIPIYVAQKSYKRLIDANYNISFKIEEGVEHDISDKGFEEGSKFIRNIFC